MHTRIKILLTSLVLICALALSSAIFYSFSLWQSQSEIDWPLESQKAGQLSFWGRYPVSDFGQLMAVGDVNGDGIEDLITRDSYFSDAIGFGADVYVIPGPLAFNQTYTMPEKAALVFTSTIDVIYIVDQGDMNGDGFDDIVMGEARGPDTWVYLGSSDIRAGSPLTLGMAAENMALTIHSVNEGMVLCDFNGDGYQDLFIEEYS